MSKKRHPRSIINWVEAQDSGFASAIRDLCMDGALTGRGGGTTLLYPTDDVRAAIVEGAYSTEPENAVALINAHIITSAAKSTSDFRKGLGTLHGIKLEVEAANGRTVTLRGGAHIKAAGDFSPGRGDKVAVWVVEEGEIPLEGPAYQQAKRGRRGTAEKRERVSSPSATANNRVMVAARVERAYDVAMRRDRCRTEDPYLTHVVSLLNFLRSHKAKLYETVRPLVDRDPAVSFYLLVEPYKTVGDDYTLGDDVLFGPEGWNEARMYEEAVSEFESVFEHSDAPPDAPLSARGMDHVRSAVDNTRLGILGDDGRKGNKVATPKDIREAYELLCSGNTIAGTGDILPKSTCQALTASKKLWQDELRFAVHAQFQDLRRMPAHDGMEYAELLQNLRMYRPGDNYEREISIAGAEQMKGNVAPGAEFAQMKRFINSTDFLYVAVSAGLVGGAWGDIPVTAAVYASADELDSIYNAEKGKQAYLNALRASGGDKPRQLDLGTLAQIRHYMSRHDGKLPPELESAKADKAGDDDDVRERGKTRRGAQQKAE